MASINGDIKKGFKWTSTSKLFTSLVQILQLVILARVLDSAEFGLVSMSMLIVGFAQVFSDFGIGNGIIQRTRLIKEELQTLFIINIFISSCITLVVYFSAYIIAALFQEPLVIPLIKALSVVFVINSLGSVYLNCFRKKLRFNLIAKVEMFSRVLSFAVSIIVALVYQNAWALVASTICYALTSSFIYLVLGMSIFKPSLAFKVKSVKDIMNFGIYNVFQNVVVYFNSQFDTILIGALLGKEQLGIYTIIKQLVLKPTQVINPIITSVMFPVMARLKGDLEELTSCYKKTIQHTSMCNFVIYGVLIVLSEYIVSLVLGDKWVSYTNIFNILCIYAILKSSTNPIGILVLASGKAKWGFFWSILEAILMPICLYLGYRHGVLGMAWGLVVFQVVLFLPGWYYLVRKLSHLKLYNYVLTFTKTMAPSIISSIFLIAALEQLNIPYGNNARSLAVVSIIVPLFLFIYMSILRLTDRILYDGIKNTVWRTR